MKMKSNLSKPFECNIVSLILQSNKTSAIIKSINPTVILSK
ncbi:MAG: hypothetical protein ACTS40_00265 [Candidatus Hodgkinia cicadicola]